MFMMIGLALNVVVVLLLIGLYAKFDEIVSLLRKMNTTPPGPGPEG